MKRNITGIVLVLAGLAAMAGAADQPTVKIYVPRNVTVNGGAMSLGTLVMVECEDPALAAKASAVEMGRLPQPGETIPINRTTILSRLASCGIETAHVTISGADAVSVGIQQATITPEQFMHSADAYLAVNAPNKDSIHWRCTQPPGELVLGLPQDVQLEAKILTDASLVSALKVQVRVLSGGKEVATREFYYKPMYLSRRAVAKETLTAGSILCDANITMETAEAETKAAEDDVPVLGSAAVRTIQAGEVIHTSMTTTKRPNPKELLVRCNQPVSIRLAGAGFALSALGTALQDGRVGDLVKVRNSDTQRIITARVTPQGNVEPIIEEACK